MCTATHPWRGTGYYCQDHSISKQKCGVLKYGGTVVPLTSALVTRVSMPPYPGMNDLKINMSNEGPNAVGGAPFLQSVLRQKLCMKEAMRLNPTASYSR